MITLFILYLFHIVWGLAGGVAFLYYKNDDDAPLHKKYFIMTAGASVYLWNMVWLIARLLLASPYLLGHDYPHVYVR